MPAPANLTETQRERLLGLLAERARLLAPSQDLLDRALRRALPPNGSVAPGDEAVSRSSPSASRRAVAIKTPVRTPADIPSVSADQSAPSTAVATVIDQARVAPAGADGAAGPVDPATSAEAPAEPVHDELPMHDQVREGQPPLSHDGGTAVIPAVDSSPGAEPSGPSVLVPEGPSAETASAQTVLSHHGEGETAQVQAVGTGRFVLLKPGRIIAGYRIEGLLGLGGMGQVYRATQLSMNRGVAYKVLSPKLAGNPRFRERFLREARAAGRLHHPNLIAVHDVGEADGMMYFSMELVKGASLASVLKQHGKSPESRALEIVRQVLEALRIAHAAGIVHRDIKPDNLMITAQGMVKVADLGLSLSDENDEDAYTTQAGTLMGTPNYMAPEQGRDAHKVDLRADLYAVGATLYHLVCGVVPFPGETPMEVVIKASSQPLKFPEPGPSPGMRALIATLMAKRPEDRPQSADAALELIAKLRRSKVTANPEQHPDATNAIARARARRWRRSLRRALWGTAVAIGVVVIAAFIALMLSRSQWGIRQREIESLTADHRFHEAVTALDAFQPGLFGARKVDIDPLRAEVEKAWDAWAVPLAAPVFDDFHKLLTQKKVAAAYEALSKNLKEEWRSPAVRHDQEECERQFEEAMSTVERLDTARARELPPEILKRIAEIWSGFTITPPASLEVHEGLARFTGTGTAVGGSVFAPMGGLAGRQHRPTLVVNARIVSPAAADDSDAWSLVVSATRTLSVSRQGLVLHETGKPDRQLVTVMAGWVSFRLRRTANDLEVRIGPSESAEWIALGAGATGQLSLRWHLADAHAAEVRMRPQLARASE
jgi:hypothetical protein